MCQIDILLNDDDGDDTIEVIRKISRGRKQAQHGIYLRKKSIKKRAAAAAAESFIVLVAKMESKLLLMELNYKQVLFKL